MSLEKLSPYTVLALTTIVAFAACMVLRANFLVATLLFFGLPSLVYSQKRPEYRREAAKYSLLLTVFLLIPLDYVATMNKAWEVPHSVFALRIGGLIPVENVICGLLFTYLILMLYHVTTPKQQMAFRYAKLALYLAIVFVPLMLLLLFAPNVLLFPYPYAVIGTPFTLIPVIFLLRYKEHRAPFLKVCLPLFLVLVLYEIQGLLLDQWVFPSEEYLGWIRFRGIAFPVEEVIFWMLAASIAILAWYESCRVDAGSR